MNRKRVIVYGILALLAVGVFFGRPYLENLYLTSIGTIQDLGSNLAGTITETVQQSISAPPPLRSEKDVPHAYLAQNGVIDLTNLERQNNGQKSLKENSELDAAAHAKAQDILAKQYFDHVSPDGHGPDYFVSSAGYSYITIGENLALGNFADDKDLVDAWMASPGHRENILRPQFQEIGVAVIQGTYEGKSTWVAVQEFGTALSVCPMADGSLKKKIDANTNEIDQLSSELKDQQASIKKMSPRDPGYGQAVDDYNSLVNDFNSLVTKTKSLIATYNTQVNKYNACVKNF